MGKLKEGDIAPDFTAKIQTGDTVRLSDFKGKKVVLYFYPKDNTPGCTAEAKNLNENLEDLQNKGFVVLGVSPDSEASHQRFIDKHGLKFDLISDPDKKILEMYDAWGEKKNYGRTYMGVLRKTYIIDENGKIEKIIEKVKTKDHTSQIYKELNIN
ncbi:MAG: thioredoxin-dependent thiol peroxidase [Chlorobi bacterium]|nr:thioredoxin-dependent thiol peroxidase [Chlorobiota bacterium]